MIMMNKETPFAVKAKGVFMIVTDGIRLQSGGA